MPTLAHRIQELTTEWPRGWAKRLADYCKVKPPSVSDWISGETKSIDGRNLSLVAEFFGVYEKWLSTGIGPKFTGRTPRATELHGFRVPGQSDADVIPDYGKPHLDASATEVTNGAPSIPWEAVVKKIKAGWTAPLEPFWVELDSDVLAPRWPSGFRLKFGRPVDGALAPAANDIVIASVNGEPVIRVLRMGIGSEIELVAPNETAYKTLSARDGYRIEVIAICVGKEDSRRGY